jgi:hypothetical protein
MGALRAIEAVCGRHASLVRFNGLQYVIRYGGGILVQRLRVVTKQADRDTVVERGASLIFELSLE